MTITVGEQMCRLVVCGPDRQIELAVPAQVLVADLLPALLHHLGEDLANTGLLHGGWVLQRLGAPPFDEDGTVASLGLRDGDTVHLRPRAEQIPPVDFDDLIDGVATGARARSGLWQPQMVRWAALGVLGVLLGTGVAVLAAPGPPVPRLLCAAGLALGCLAAAFALTRAVGDRAAGTVFLVAAVAHAGLAGLLVPETGRPDATLTVDGPRLVVAATAVFTTAALGRILLGRAGPLFAAVLTAALFTAAGAALAAFVPMNTVRAAAVVAVAATIAGTAVPLLAFRLAGLHLEPLPVQPEHLQDGIDPEPSEPLLARTVTADRYMTALHTGLAAVTLGALTLVGAADGWAAPTLVVLVAAVRLLAARPMTSAWHRLALCGPAVVGLATVLLHVSTTGTGWPRLLVPAVLVPIGAALLVTTARTLPGRRLMPYWGRIGDLTHTLAMVAVFPVLLAVLDVYAFARALGG
ncbi:type VII secretion integral membrane protein EccD [Verrucosispora sp. SN26_14.1]|uniref:type VII secretion integral membrane protein EccD n=1 Tax=Verrucosispora sp. SN26_14.1 TaxID=2527879 RepID=UPI001034DCDD|nr:type VII secretion integral membrane protein EccD [Verrucosispora sp. SN26_14.1]TBL34425.1 type VII secretion integral membrane protein EccD [Verrucosispora sp. SN26_14.1]